MYVDRGEIVPSPEAMLSMLLYMHSIPDIAVSGPPERHRRYSTK
jgi:hypothetical protein